MTYSYYEVTGNYEGQIEVLFGSFNQNDCKYELEAERDSWKGDGYKSLKIIKSETDKSPDPEVYTKKEFRLIEIDRLAREANFRGDTVECERLLDLHDFLSSEVA